MLGPGQLPNKSAININNFPCAAGHSNKALFRKIAAQPRFVLEGELLGCRACFMSKGLRKSIKQSTHTRADYKLGRVCVDLSGPKVVESLGRKRYPFIVRDHFSRYMWVYFVRHKSDTAESCE